MLPWRLKKSERMERMMIKFRRMTLPLVVSLVGLGPADGQVGVPSRTGEKGHSAVDDFSTNSNPLGPWSYGRLDGGNRFQLFSSAGSGDLVNPGIRGWSGNTPLPYVVKNLTRSPLTAVNRVGSATVTLFLDVLSLHPGQDCSVSDVRWTAPSSGKYDIVGFFEGLDFAGPTSTDAHVYVNGVERHRFDVNTYRVRYPFNLVTPLRTGEMVDFSVGCGADRSFLSDSTGLSVRILLEQVDTKFVPDPIEDVTSRIEFEQPVCLSDRKILSCTPERPTLKSYASGKYRAILPAHLPWSVGVPNPATGKVIVSDASGTVCWDTSLPQEYGCNGPDGNPNKAGAGFLLPDQRAGALIFKTENGRTSFSINDRNSTKGHSELKDHEGYFEFYVEIR
jgi:hypothetical protein